jgi:hypothetical protein
MRVDHAGFIRGAGFAAACGGIVLKRMGEGTPYLSIIGDALTMRGFIIAIPADRVSTTDSFFWIVHILV